MSGTAVFSRPAREGFGATVDGGTVEASASALSWAAVIGGTVVATGITLVLVVLGSGVGLAWVSPFGAGNPSATAFTLTAAIWLILVQWISAAMGGYITGRLRTRWVGTHTHEVFFRDTAHGLLTWAAATLVVIALVASTSSAILGTGVRAASNVAGGATQAATTLASARGYDIDTMLRPAQPQGGQPSNDIRAEAERIFAQSAATGGDMSAADRTYLAQTVASHAGISQGDAEKRVDAAIADAKSAAAKAKDAADAARKAAATTAIFTAVSMLIGAFVACAAAALGGSLRDEHP
jgi:hypothetical protein